QRISPETPFYHRLLVAFGVTDEIFGISIAEQGYLKPAYNYGAMSVAIPGWCMGTALGVIFGEILPPMIVGCLSVALYGMFIAIIIPPAKKSVTVGVVVIVSMLLSYLMTVLPVVREISSGFRIIIITVAVAAVAAVAAPVEDSHER
ncbi:MAG: AzlC family ABC transporter permease, partial [Clostridia bacterium]|nr:AzlC family ABC transporter permease [Clostridia bacterium]